MENKTNVTALLIPGFITLVVSGVLGYGIYVATEAEQQEIDESVETVAEEKEIETIPFEEIVVKDSNRFIDDGDKILQTGINGQIEHLYEVTRDFEGTIINKELLGSEARLEKQDKVISRGTLDREEAIATIEERLAALVRYMQDGDYDSLYPLLSQEDRILYSREQLRGAANTIGFQVENYAQTGDLQFLYPQTEEYDASLLRGIQDIDDGEGASEENGDESEDDNQETSGLLNQTPGLIADVPIELTFQSTSIGRQRVPVFVKIVNEGNIWNVRYFGPTEVIPLNRTLTEDDGGKTYGNPLLFELSLSDMILFSNIDYLYFTYVLKNNSSLNMEPEINDRGRETGEMIDVLAQAAVTSATLTDSADTGYQLIDSVFFLQQDDFVTLGNEALGRMVFEPAPGPEIDSIFMSADVVVEDGEYEVSVNFGEIPLERQNSLGGS